MYAPKQYARTFCVILLLINSCFQLQVEFDALVDLIAGVLNPEEQQSLEELHQYMLEDEGSWALGDGFLNFVGESSLLSDLRGSKLTECRSQDVFCTTSPCDQRPV